MKVYLRKIFYVIVNFASYIYLKFYYLKNFNKPRVFIYTDSRGFEISKIFNRKSPFNSYVNHFVKNYRCHAYICPEKHTTIFDFLYVLYLKQKIYKYDYIISHIGVVDFSPRPFNDVKPILNLKKHKIEKIFGTELFNLIIDIKPYKSIYFGQQTSSIIIDEFLAVIAEKFNPINNFIWITCNPVDTEWRGNYKRDRPKNINIVNEKSKKLLNMLNSDIKVVDLTSWSLEDIHKFTCDNIHMSKLGMNLIENKIKEKLDEF